MILLICDFELIMRLQNSVQVNKMENFLLDLILFSEKRMNVLLLLLEGPRDMETIKKILNANETSIQPQVKKLKEAHLIVQEKNIYRLSAIGKIVTMKMKHLLETFSVLEENTDYWADRDMKEIPDFLLHRINELGQCSIIEPYLDYIFEMIPEYMENAENAKNLAAAIPYFHPLFPSFYLRIAKRGTSVSLVLSEPILRRWVEDYKQQTEQFIKMENTRLFICANFDRVPAITSADNFMALALFPKSEVFDRKYIIGFRQEALNWGKELYDHYEQLSERVHNLSDWRSKTGLKIENSPTTYQVCK
jgi:predicted transcriptional regulator